MRQTIKKENNSLKTFFIYSMVVLFFIVIALAVKIFFVVQASRFDGRHQFILSINQNDKAKKIIKFNPSNHEIFVLDTKEYNIIFISDAVVKVENNFQLNKEPSELLKSFVLNYNSLNTDLTIFDLTRLTILTYKSKLNTVNEGSINNVFIDDAILLENINIQIINASGISGMAKRLERVLGNMGCNIIEITTSQSEQKTSKIQYFGEKTYTLKKLEKSLHLPIEKIDTKGIADIIIILGEDSKNSNYF